MSTRISIVYNNDLHLFKETSDWEDGTDDFRFCLNLLGEKNLSNDGRFIDRKHLLELAQKVIEILGNGET